jgi:chemotaxis protein methyltransferase CheR
MTNSNISEIYKAVLSESHFQKIASFIASETGIKMPSAKKVMVQARLKKRLRELNMTSFDDYIKYIFSKEGMDSEVIHVFDVISTNKTDFFREPTHFTYLRDSVLPEFIATNPKSTFKVWSAACSSGEEPVTIGITLSEFQQSHQNFDFSVTGTDISTHILKMAVNGVYTDNRVRPAVPEYLVRKYFMKSRDEANKTLKVVPEMRQKIKYNRLNFMDENYNLPEKYDLVFCRNVLIYFDRPTQEAVVQKICKFLKPGGYLFHGHSESLLGMDLPLKNVKPTIFRKI